MSNHGRLDLDCFILAGLILRSRERLVRLLADHLWFGIPVVGRLWARAGAVDGTRENAARLLSQGELVLTYPGGVREIMNGRFGHEHIEWSGRLGFARVAIEGGVPVIPVVSVGVNNGFVFITSGRRLGRLLFRKILRLGPAYSEYRDPLAIGLVPFPLPFSAAVHLPLPCKVRYVVGDPIWPAARASDGDALGPASDGAGSGAGEDVAELAARVEEVMRGMLARHGRP